MNKIISLRKKIDLIDKEIIAKISKRFEIVKKLGELKRANKITVTDENRENEMRLNRKKLAKEFGISFVLLEKIFTALIKESKKLQK